MAQNIQNSEEKDAQERSRIAIARTQHTQSNAKARTACYQSFAVNDCLEYERGQHAARMDDLRRQEIALNDAQRKERGAKQVQNMDNKASAEKQADAAKNRAEALQRTQERQEAADKKRLDKETKAQDLLQNPPASRLAKTPPTAPNQVLVKTKPTTNAADESSKAAANLKAYNERLAEAARRKAQLEKKRAEQTKAPAAALSIPTESSVK